MTRALMRWLSFCFCELPVSFDKYLWVNWINIDEIVRIWNRFIRSHTLGGTDLRNDLLRTAWLANLLANENRRARYLYQSSYTLGDNGGAS